MKVKIYTEPAFGSLNVLFYEKKDGKRFVVKPVNLYLEEVSENSLVDPTFTLGDLSSHEFFQAMADEIFKLGIKPSQQPVLENELTAVKYHLEDMRKLVFK